MASATITWKAFGDRPEANRYISSATVAIEGTLDSLTNNPLLETIYKVTNLQNDLKDFGAHPVEIALWDSIKVVLPENRTHTSLSIGDEIQINRSLASYANQDGPTYRVTETGFELVGA
jgi:hypothetical protein